LQAAPPTTFGLKTAGWLAAMQRSRKQLNNAFRKSLVVQFGGASGTVAALGRHGLQAGQALAEELKLAYPDGPWHAHRDRLAQLMCACGVVVGALGKIARDISLLTQNEVGEAAEGGAEGRGGSSTMPHKQNPVGCALTLAAASRVPALVSSFLSAMVQEHERGLGGWQAEWSTVSNVIQATGMAAASIADVAEGLTIDPSRMRLNIESTYGVVFAERVAMLLSPKLGREAAHKILAEATRRCREEKRRLRDVLAGMKEVTSHLDSSVLRDLEIPEQFLGVAGAFQDRLLASADPERDGPIREKE
jgi:3-carboxy-cis,cis-muconate cycloisomerase